VLDRSTSFETKISDVFLGGSITVTNLSRLEWTKMWLFPGLTDAATRVELRSTFDLSTGRGDAELRYGAASGAR